MGPGRLMMMIHKSLKECDNILRIFHDKQPNIRAKYHREVEHHVRHARLLTAPNGRKRDFFGRITDSVLNEGISFIPQATVSDQLKFSLYETFKECETYVRPLAEAHDGFLSEVKEGREVEYARVFKKNVETPIDFSRCSLSRDFKLVIPMESEYSKESWQDLKKLDLN